MTIWKRKLGLFVGLLSALVIFVPSITTFAKWQVLPGHRVQVISLIGTTKGASNLSIVGSGSASRTVIIVGGDTGVKKSQIHSIATLIKSVSSHILERSLGKLPTNQTEIFLYSQQSGYAGAVKKAFPSKEVSTVVRQTGGFTLGSKVYVPLYKYHDSAFLANTLTHELTHATLNEIGVGSKLPTWMNEGLAWYNGTAAEMTVDKRTALQMTRQLDTQLQQAQKLGELQSIHRDGGNVLEKNPPYNIEFQDYLGVKYLINTYGEDKVTRLLSVLKRDSFSKSFKSVFPISATQFTTSFTGTGRPS
ncbi:hypothetical protein [Alicyclobacillus sp. SO9]|uniref:peptidase MA family metallohydrolase n=1 Tax=Alicyclobacillus sp. SO9 TaxID=2665646 RepID=UPI0018E7AA33|nr:hypothetical protein [Alicyclobacillus sp. SO9]QQE78078.1 hypothetical protein GI364_19625 [Alicyclobacillus sp. SO9]